MEALGMGEISLGVGGDVLGELGEFRRCRGQEEILG